MRTNARGFTLIELLIAMVIGMIVLAGIVGAYRAQQRSRTNQIMVLEMQQNARAALALMRREIRMANYDPLGGAVEGFSAARADTLTFSFDANADSDDADEGERITYGLANPDDGILGREGEEDAGFDTLAFDIHALGFAYAVDMDGDGMPDTYGGGVSDPIIWLYDSNGDGVLDRHLDTNQDGLINANDNPGGGSAAAFFTPLPPLNRICAVQIWLLARTRSPLPEEAESTTYVVGDRHIGTNDRFKRILLTGTVQVRNPS